MPARIGFIRAQPGFDNRPSSLLYRLVMFTIGQQLPLIEDPGAHLPTARTDFPTTADNRAARRWRSRLGPVRQDDETMTTCGSGVRDDLRSAVLIAV